MEKDIYVDQYIKKLEELFVEYKKEPTDEKEIEISTVVIHFLRLGRRLPLDQTVLFDSNTRKLFKELFDDKGISVCP